MARQKTFLFHSLNSYGHINSALGIADRLVKLSDTYTCVFVLLGDDTKSNTSATIQQHGHKVIVLSEINVHEDYELDPDTDPCAPIDEQAMQRQGKHKIQFAGSSKWPQIILRNQNLLRLEPVEAFVRCTAEFEGRMMREVIDNHDQLESAIRAVTPDVIVVDAYYTPPCVMSPRLGALWTRLYTANPLGVLEATRCDGLRPPSCVGAQIMTKQSRVWLQNNQPEQWSKLLDEWKHANARQAESFEQVGHEYRELMLSYDVEPRPAPALAPDSPHLNIYLFPGALDYACEDDILRLPAKWIRCDSLLRAQNVPGDTLGQKWTQILASRQQQHKPIVYFSLGTIACGDVRLVRKFVDIFASDPERQYVVSKGTQGHLIDLTPYDNLVGDNYVPQPLVLQRANLAIVHGGNNTVSECMFYGVPMIVVPVFADQLDNAQRVVDLQLGKSLNVWNCTPSQVLATIDQLLADTSLISRIKRIGTNTQANDCSDDAVKLLARLAEQGKLDQSDIESYRAKSANTATTTV